MRSRRSIACALLVLTGLGIGGCGEPTQVTYVDPNDDAPIGEDSGLASEPVARFGVDSIERSRSVARIRGALAVARTLAASDAEGAAAVVEAAVVDHLPSIEPRIIATDPRLAANLRAALERLTTAPPANAVEYTREVRRISTAFLDPAYSAVVPAAARQDAGFRSSLLYETLNEAATDYEAAFSSGGDAATAIHDYRNAYGLVIDASTRQLEALPETARPAIRSALDKVSRRSFPGPTPPSDPRSAEEVLGELTSIADQVAQAAGIDPTYPTPDPGTPDQLRSLKRDVASAVEGWERGDRTGALRQLTTADATYLVPAAASVASISTELLRDLEAGVLVDLPRAMRTEGGDVVAAGADLDATIDEAVTQVETELTLLRDSE